MIADTLEGGGRAKSNALMKTVALRANKPQSKSRFKLDDIADTHRYILKFFMFRSLLLLFLTCSILYCSAIKIPPKNPNEPVFEIAVIVDPVSRGAQKVGPIVSVLREVLNSEIKIYLNCQERLSDMPLKR